MGNYKVKYGFSKESTKKFLPTFRSTRSATNMMDYHVRTYACFANFFYERYAKLAYIDSPLLYSLYCNVDMLKHLIKEMNALKCGITVKFLGGRVDKGLVGYDRGAKIEGTFHYEMEFVDFKFGQTFRILSHAACKKLGKKFLPLGNYIIEINTNCETKNTKPLIEYLIMVVFRMLDAEEGYLKKFEPDWQDDIFKAVVNVSNEIEDGHCLYDENRNRSNNHKFSVKFLKEALDIKNVNKFGKGHNQQYSNYRQTDIINAFSTIKEVPVHV